MAEENIIQEFRMKNREETKNYFIEERNHNELMSKKNKKICTALNLIEDLLIFASVVTGCINISAFSTFVGMPIGIVRSAIRLKIFAQ